MLNGLAEVVFAFASFNKALPAVGDKRLGLVDALHNRTAVAHAHAFDFVGVHRLCNGANFVGLLPQKFRKGNQFAGRVIAKGIRRHFGMILNDKQPGQARFAKFRKKFKSIMSNALRQFAGVNIAFLFDKTLHSFI